MNSIPTYENVKQAVSALEGNAIKTTVMTSRILDEQLGARIFLKCESFQHSGSFKFRGAYNALYNLPSEQKKAGVVVYSSGNHAQAIALSSKLLGVPNVILMPKDAPRIKVQATKGYGGNVTFYDRYTDDREMLVREIAKERGMTVIPSSDHIHVVAGQGTAVNELIAEVGELDYLFIPCGGGGLLAGSALSVSALYPSCKVYGVEPESGNDVQLALYSGHIVYIDTCISIADGAQTQHVGAIPFEIIREKVTDILTVTDDELVDTMRFLAATMKLVVEPTGCLGLAALRKMGVNKPFKGEKIGVILSGGNVDIEKFCSLIGTSKPLSNYNKIRSNE